MWQSIILYRTERYFGIHRQEKRQAYIEDIAYQVLAVLLFLLICFHRVTYCAVDRRWSVDLF